MKILQVNCVYNTGSTGKITYDIHHSLRKQGIESVVYYGRGTKCNEENVHKICGELYGKFQNLKSRVTGLMYGGCVMSTHRLIRYIRKENPDVVHLQCINGYFVNIYRLVQWLKENKMKTVLTLHAEFMYTANCGYAIECEKWQKKCGKCPDVKRATKSILFDNTHKSFRKMEKAFAGFEGSLEVVAVSPWVEERATKSPILEKANCQVILNGINTEIFCYKDADNLREEHKIGKKKCVFHVTATFSDQSGHIKGGEYIIALAQRLKNVIFLVAGEYQISKEIPHNIIFLGKIQDQKKMAEYYSMADLTVITSKKETFSMPCAESMCCGTPVVGFFAGGPERIALSEYSDFVEYGNIDALEKCAKEWLFEQNIKSKKISEHAKILFGRDEMTNQYIELYRRLTSE